MARIVRAALRCALPSVLALGAGIVHAEEAAATGATCPAEQAIYTLPSEDGNIRASFIPAKNWPSVVTNLYLKLTTTQRDYWFTFAASNGYGGISLLPVANPYAAEAEDGGPASTLPETETPEDEAIESELLGRLRFMALGSDLAVAENPPSAGDQAPPYLMMPELGLALWYDPASLTTDKDAGQDFVPRGVFKLTGCLAEAPPKAWP